ncbi:hypothetical protein, partial [Sphingobacterium shayense]|uniref:hypothetical protein n=1 Tax=Sphingobacterium shayense TaxID=626343 RepID=UPI001C1307BE
MKNISRENFVVPQKLRERLLRNYRNETDKIVLLNKIPTVPYIIKYKVIPSGFLDTERERLEILRFIKTELNWDVNPNTLSVALKRMDSSIQITKNPVKASGNLYK